MAVKGEKRHQWQYLSICRNGMLIRKIGVKK